MAMSHDDELVQPDRRRSVATIHDVARQPLDQTPYFKALHVSMAGILPQSLWWNHGQPGGKLVGVGVAAEVMVLHYNKAVFAHAGVAAPPSDAAHAWTWDRFVAVATKLTMDRHGKHPGSIWHRHQTHRALRRQ